MRHTDGDQRLGTGVRERFWHVGKHDGARGGTFESRRLSDHVTSFGAIAMRCGDQAGRNDTSSPID